MFEPWCVLCKSELNTGWLQLKPWPGQNVLAWVFSFHSLLMGTKLWWRQGLLDSQTDLQSSTTMVQKTCLVYEHWKDWMFLLSFVIPPRLRAWEQVLYHIWRSVWWVHCGQPPPMLQPLGLVLCFLYGNLRCVKPRWRHGCVKIDDNG